MIINNCSSCGGKVEFSPLDKSLKCVKCGSLYPIEYKQEYGKHPIEWIPENAKVEAWANENRACKCNVCGAQITFNKYDVTSYCQYCHADALVPLKDLPGLQPEKIIPFKIDKTQAKTEFDKRTKKRKFLPNDFKNNLPNVKTNATYLSSFAFDGYVSATYSGRQRLTRTKRGANGKTITEVYYRNFSGKIAQQYNNIIVEASDKILQEEIKKILPYDFSESYDYDNAFIKGYSVGYYNQDIEISEKVAKCEMLNDIERRIRQMYSSIDSLTINPTYSNIEYNYTLLPAYFVNFEYKNKQYINIMNGQNGKVTGKVPRSGLKITLFVLFILLLIGVPTLAILLSV